MGLSGLGLAMARADEKEDRRSRQYKLGAAVLGAGALYYGLKKKNPIGTVVTGAGAYYAYKKSKENKQNSERDRYGYDVPFPGEGSVYPDDNDYDGNATYPDREPRRGRGRRAERGNEFPIGGYNGPDDSYSRDAAGDDYGPVGDGDYLPGDYAQNGDYPNYGLNGLRSQRSNSRGKAARTPQAKRRIEVK
jgi:hypothetical protein